MTTDDKYDWSRFTLRIAVNASPAELWRAFTTREGLERWFLREAPFFNRDGTERPADVGAQPGDTYAWRWHGWPDEVQERGTVLQAREDEGFKFVFGEAGNVTVTLHRISEGVMVTLLQDEIPADKKIAYHLGCTKGWNFYLTNLKSIYEGGIDLRNKNEGIVDVINS